MNPDLHALLIDDEPLARLELRRLLQRHPQVEVVGEADTINVARERLAQADYDLVFLDIQLRGGSGFELLEFIPPHAHIVFVTAFDGFAIRAFEVNALDYLLKPVTAERLASTLNRINSEDTPTAATVPAPDAGEPPLGIDDRVFVKSGSTTRFVPVNQIASITSAENYTDLQLIDGSHLLALRTLKSWEAALPSPLFVRIHRQTLVNLNQVRAIVRSAAETVHFQFHHGLTDLSASRRRLVELRQKFAEAGLERLLP
jgi:two-component system, LytTR family, response regulator